MSLLKRAKLVRENYAVEFVLPVLFVDQREALAEHLKSIEDEKESEAARDAWIEANHELKLTVTRLSDREQKDALKAGYGDAEFGGVVPITFALDLADALWVRIRRHVKKAVEKAEDGSWKAVADKELAEFFDAMEKHDVDGTHLIVRAYNEAKAKDREAARADQDFLDEAS